MDQATAHLGLKPDSVYLLQSCLAFQSFVKMERSVFPVSRLLMSDMTAWFVTGSAFAGGDQGRQERKVGLDKGKDILELEMKTQKKGMRLS